MRSRGLALGAAALLPLALMLRELAFRYPEVVESVYGRRLYPLIARVMAKVSGSIPFSLAEAGLASLALVGAAYLIAMLRRQLRKGISGLLAFAWRGLALLWVAAGLATFSFLLLWGLNYARPTLDKRMGLSVDTIRPDELLALGRHCASLSSSLHASLGQLSDRPTRLPMAFSTLDQTMDRRLRELALPGYQLSGPTAPAKRLFLSPVISYLGLSGIFVPFTGEPAVNSLLPDWVLPMAVAHEKSHQRGVTDEGEANLVAFLACSRTRDVPYLRYAAYLYAASELLTAAAVESPEEAKSAWKSMALGPLQDLVAVRDFWTRYYGPVARAADRINDRYLKSFGVREGAESYERVVQLLVALDRKGQL